MNRAEVIEICTKATEKNEQADLHGANLKGVDLSRVNLRSANLSWADLSWANLRGADLRGADLSGAEGKNFYVSYFGQHHAIAAGGYISIGCERHTIEYWLNNYADIGKQNEYSNSEIEMYGNWIKIVSENLDK